MIRYDVLQGSPEWLAVRLGIPTASNFKRILTPDRLQLSKQASRYMHEKLVEWLFGRPVYDEFETAWMERGHAMEDEARAWYSMEFDATVETVGFFTSDDGRVGASPDGLVGDDGIIEIKTLSAVNHVAALLGDADDYRLQVQGQLWIAERKWCDRIYYNPELRPVVEHVERDEEIIEKIASAVTAFNERLDEAKAKLIAMGCKAKGLR